MTEDWSHYILLVTTLFVITNTRKNKKSQTSPKLYDIRGAKLAIFT